MTCTGNGTAEAGQYWNLGTASGTSTGSASCPGTTVTDDDPSHYWGECPGADPAIDIEKATNGHDADAAPGPTLQIGDPVAWTYEVTNTGDVTLDNVDVTDNQGVAVSCPTTTLAAGASMTCTGNGTAEAGQYWNLGTASGTSAGSASCPGTTVTDDDPSHYWGECPGANPAIRIEKATNGHDADAAPGPTLQIGDPVAWTYEVTNTGDVTLDNVD
ncbi:MAG: hypothetical protein GY718_12060, partial [Lentisphaerae bacterium]|nr:hypothetical protein [Lentisphaerota bacterium]